ncbi:2OG-Fe(II) oxygenase [Chitinivorax sp. B]|uniref:prolyl hydroxylase family protein n=1 Tax=Chitinivorax sp. B TaxID=2502235 RepID=UPI0010F9918E|nr:2OG-Fe(II) oxygenase [Chitinivorax sp. B]
MLPDAQYLSLPALLSCNVCAELMIQAEAKGFSEATVGFSTGEHMAKHIRNNDRLIWDDDELAAQLWSRVQPLLPLWPTLDGAVGLNPRFRFYRYAPGQRFKPHKDGSITLPNGQISRFTILFYLNDVLAGGATTLLPGGPAAEQAYRAISIRPCTGDALIFPHTLWHEGTPVLAGQKYVLRSDILFDAKSSDRTAKRR